MGQSTDAILAYAIDPGWDEGEEPWAETEQDPDEWLLDALGVLPAYPEAKDREHWRAYFKAKREAEEAAPVELVEHCHHEYTMYLLAVRGTRVRNARGDVTDVTDTLGTAPDASGLLSFCEAQGIEDPRPRWLLVSYWG